MPSNDDPTTTDPTDSSPGLAAAAGDAARDPAAVNALILQGLNLLVQVAVAVMEAAADRDRARAALYDSLRTAVAAVSEGVRGALLSRWGGVALVLFAAVSGLVALQAAGVDVDLNALAGYAVTAWNGCEDTP